MQYVYQKRDSKYLVRINRGGSIIASLLDLAKKEKIVSGFFIGIGATDKTTLAHYSVENQKYSEKEYDFAFELTNLTGSIATLKGDLSVHAHATLADDQFKTYAGHLVEARVSGTCEVLVIPLGKEIKKKFDKQTGLNILDL